MCEIAACALIMLHGKNDLTKGPEMHFFLMHLHFKAQQKPESPKIASINILLSCGG